MQQQIQHTKISTKRLCTRIQRAVNVHKDSAKSISQTIGIIDTAQGIKQITVK